jgi:hypothetical protein
MRVRSRVPLRGRSKRSHSFKVKTPSMTKSGMKRKPRTRKFTPEY